MNARGKRTQDRAAERAARKKLLPIQLSFKPKKTQRKKPAK